MQDKSEKNVINIASATLTETDKVWYKAHRSCRKQMEQNYVCFASLWHYVPVNNCSVILGRLPGFIKAVLSNGDEASCLRTQHPTLGEDQQNYEVRLIHMNIFA